MKTLARRAWLAIKSAGAAIWAAAGILLAFVIYGLYREHRGRKEAEYRIRRRKLDRQIAEHEKTIERTDRRDRKLEARLEGLRAERARLNRDAVEELEEAASRVAETEEMDADALARRAEELLGLGGGPSS